MFEVNGEYFFCLYSSESLHKEGKCGLSSRCVKKLLLYKSMALLGVLKEYLGRSLPCDISE